VGIVLIGTREPKDALLNTLDPLLAGLDSLSLWEGPGRSSYDALDLVVSRNSGLRHLTVNVTSQQALLPLLTHLPALRSLYLNRVILSTNVNQMLPRFAHLVDIELAQGNAALADLVRLISLAANSLTSLRIGYRMSPLTAGESHTLPCLRHLHFEAATLFALDAITGQFETAPLQALLRYFDQPSVRTVKLGLVEEGVGVLLRDLGRLFASPNALTGVERVTLLLNEGTSERMKEEPLVASAAYVAVQAAARAREVALEVVNVCENWSV
jgi:hypothetical protein